MVGMHAHRGVEYMATRHESPTNFLLVGSSGSWCVLRAPTFEQHFWRSTHSYLTLPRGRDLAVKLPSLACCSTLPRADSVLSEAATNTTAFRKLSHSDRSEQFRVDV